MLFTNSEWIRGQRAPFLNHKLGLIELRPKERVWAAIGSSDDADCVGLKKTFTYYASRYLRGSSVADLLSPGPVYTFVSMICDKVAQGYSPIIPYAKDLRLLINAFFSLDPEFIDEPNFVQEVDPEDLGIQRYVRAQMSDEACEALGLLCTQRYGSKQGQIINVHLPDFVRAMREEAKQKYIQDDSPQRTPKQRKAFEEAQTEILRKCFDKDKE